VSVLSGEDQNPVERLVSCLFRIFSSQSIMPVLKNSFINWHKQIT
jgi:hypothetical protein